MTGTIIAKGPGLADLASRINAEHDAVARSLNTGLEHAIACGRLLIEAKAKIPHGAWLPWLEGNCAVSPRSASAYMRVARHLPKIEAKSATVADLTFREALSLMASHATQIAALPPPVAADVLKQAETGPLKGALGRATTHERVMESQRQRAERLKQNPPVTRFIQMPVREPTAEEIARGEALADLLSHLRKVLRAWMVTNPTISADMICDTINAVYCEVQDGTIRDASEAAE